MSTQTSAAMPRYKNKTLPSEAKTSTYLEKWLGLPFHAIEFALYHLIVAPWQYMLSWLDTLSYKLENTLFKKVVGYLLMPVTLLITLIIGFNMAEQGVGFRSLLGFLLLLATYGLIFAPMERLFPWSRKWLDGGNDTSVDLMMYISGIIFGGIARFIVTLLPLTYLAAQIEPYGHQLWPDGMHPWLQVFLMRLIEILMEHLNPYLPEISLIITTMYLTRITFLEGHLAGHLQQVLKLRTD